jgi:putative Holliday junction resolvase
VRRGVRIGVDVGTVRIGISTCDPSGVLATPVETVRRDLRGCTDLERIARIVQEHDAIEVIVGLPRSLSGQEGTAARAVRAYADAVSRGVEPVPVRLVDERLSTVTAHRNLSEAGVRGRRRRPVIDQVAAVVILQDALDAERATGRPPGTVVVPETAPEGPDPRVEGRRPDPGE